MSDDAKNIPKTKMMSQIGTIKIKSHLNEFYSIIIFIEIWLQALYVTALEIPCFSFYSPWYIGGDILPNNPWLAMTGMPQGGSCVHGRIVNIITYFLKL